MHAELEQLLGDSAKSLLEHHCKTIPREKLHLPGPEFVDRVYAQTDRSTAVLRSLGQMFNHGRLAGTKEAKHVRWQRRRSPGFGAARADHRSEGSRQVNDLTGALGAQVDGPVEFKREELHL